MIWTKTNVCTYVCQEVTCPKRIKIAATAAACRCTIAEQQPQTAVKRDRPRQTRFVPLASQVDERRVPMHIAIVVQGLAGSCRGHLGFWSPPPIRGCDNRAADDQPG